mmetsp:Transcript_76903/g.217544  ORF Transcript_76903/g.217544 Transcript_76903/m.217544 type:complete len:205 (+) Transcript_76903:1070-1684(+)
MHARLRRELASVSLSTMALVRSSALRPRSEASPSARRSCALLASEASSATRTAPSWPPRVSRFSLSCPYHLSTSRSFSVNCASPAVSSFAARSEAIRPVMLVCWFLRSLTRSSYSVRQAMNLLSDLSKARNSPPMSGSLTSLALATSSCCSMSRVTDCMESSRAAIASCSCQEMAAARAPSYWERPSHRSSATAPSLSSTSERM